MNWEIDSTHSHVSFAIRVLSFSTTRGRFHALRGQIHIDEQNPVNSWAAAEIDAASINTHNKLRDAHLRSATFFDVKKYPAITFQSTKVEQVSDQGYQVTGKLTMHGITRPVTFNVAYGDRSALRGGRISLRASATIKRNDFGIGRRKTIQLVASPRVTVEIDLEAVLQPVITQEAVTIAR